MKKLSLRSALVLKIFRFRLRNVAVQATRNISERRKLNFKLPLRVYAVLLLLLLFLCACEGGSETFTVTLDFDYLGMIEKQQVDNGCLNNRAAFGASDIAGGYAPFEKM